MDSLMICRHLPEKESLAMIKIRRTSPHDSFGNFSLIPLGNIVRCLDFHFLVFHKVKQPMNNAVCSLAQ